MTDFPSLKGEFRPRPKLKKHTDELVADEVIEGNSVQIGQAWGALTSMPTPEPPPVPLAKVVSIRGYIPDYLDDELTLRAAERRVTKTFLLMEALEKTGYRVEEVDMVQDRRKKN